MIGIGATNRLETYLSPFEYTGTEVRFLHESMRLTKMMNGRISTQQFFEGNMSISRSPSHDANFLAGDFDFSTHIAASAMAVYRFTLLNRLFAVRYQFDMPLIGLMFSPAFGQSYYEMFSLGHYDHNVCATWAGNAPTFRNLLTLDAPLGSGTLRIGWRGDIRQSHVNHLKSHTWSNLFMIGYVKHFRLVKHSDGDSHKYIL